MDHVEGYTLLALFLVALACDLWSLRDEGFFDRKGKGE
jgi:hypothetical protein